MGGDTTMDINIQKQIVAHKKEKPDAEQLAFGKVFTDHMFIADYTVDKGWHNPRIVPYESITLDPAAIIFHYGQTVFEGLKAYYGQDGSVRLFRPELNMERLNHSCDRLSMPQVDEQFLLEGIKELIKVDQEWIPTAEGTSLYIRPFMIATEPNLSVSPAQTYKLFVILSPVGSYYKEGINPVKILVEKEYVRAVPGGTGTAKTAGNYAASLKAQEKAEQAGYSQVLWLDGVQHKYIEEVGSMNVFFKLNGDVHTPALNGSILEGVTRRSVIELLNHWNIKVVERAISMEEIKEAHQNGDLEEAFGTGTAAVISPIGTLSWQDEDMVIHNGEIGTLSKRLYDTITNIQYGKEQDMFNWTQILT